jgi:hypothetical protein
MARIVLGVGTSHSPLLAIGPEVWADRAKDDLLRTDFQLTDGRVVDFTALQSERLGAFSQQATIDRFREQHAAAQQALDHLRDVISEARLDLLVIIGDDQAELFSRAHNPAFAIFTGELAAMYPRGQVLKELPEWRKQAYSGYMMDAEHSFAAHPAYATELVEGLIRRGVDVAVSSQVDNPRKAGFGHAFGFVLKRLVTEAVPCIPIMLNTYFPPNVMTPGRCLDVGTAIAETLEEMGDVRVGVIASGGLSHFVTDADLDRHVLDLLRRKDRDGIRALPVPALRSGTSETLNWIMASGCFDRLSMHYCNYIPVYRTSAGSGIGLAFAVWE